MSLFSLTHLSRRTWSVALCLFVCLALALLVRYMVAVPLPAATPQGGSGRSEPVAAAPALVVVTVCPGRSASYVEGKLTARIEQWLQQAPGARQVESRSLPGVSMVRVTFRADTEPRQALASVSSLALALLPTLPAGARPPLVLPFDPARTPAVGVVTISLAASPLVSATDIARLEVCPTLAGVSGALAPVVMGGTDRIVSLHLDPDRLKALHVSPLDVAAAVRRATRPVPAGPVIIGKKQYLLEAGALPERLTDLAEAVVRHRAGGEVRVRDLGFIRDASARQTSQVRVNGRRTVWIPVYAQPGVRGAAVRAAVRKALAKMQERLSKKGLIQFLPLGGEGETAPGGGLLTLGMRAVSGTRFELVEELVAKVERLLEALIPAAERLGIYSEVGLRYDLSGGFTCNTTEQDATIRVQLTGKFAAAAGDYAAKLRRLLRQDERFASLEFHIEAGAAVPFEVQITGARPQQAGKLIAAIRRRVAQVEGANDVQLVQCLDAPALEIRVSPEKAKVFGLSAQDVALQMAAALGAPLSFGMVPLGIPIQYGGEPKKGLDDAFNTWIGSNHLRTPIALKELAMLVATEEAQVIDRLNRGRVYTVRVTAEGRAAPAVARNIEMALKALPLPEGVQVQVKAGGPPAE